MFKFVAYFVRTSYIANSGEQEPKISKLLCIFTFAIHVAIPGNIHNQMSFSLRNVHCHDKFALTVHVKRKASPHSYE